MNELNNIQKRLKSDKAFFSFIPPQFKGGFLLFLFVWYLLLFVSTYLGINNLLISPIHPIYFVLSLLALPLIFLVLTITKSYSLFAKFFLFLWGKIEKLIIQKYSAGNNHNVSIGSKTWLALISLIAHSSWLVIFIATTTALFIKFSLQSYDFYLSSTLFPKNTTFYVSIIDIINFLPNLCNISPLTKETILNTLAGEVNDTARIEWAKWILVMLLFYGVLPRLVTTCIALITLCYTKKPSRVKSSLTAKILDKAIEKPLIYREPKKISMGVGVFAIAIDFPHTLYSLPSDLLNLNKIEDFTQFEINLKKTPAVLLKIYIDASQTPDRGILRRILRLLNYTVNAEIYCIPSQHEINRYLQWEYLLLPLLTDTEVLYAQLEGNANL